MSDSLRPHRWQPIRLPHPWDSPGKSTGVGCHCPLRQKLLGDINCIRPLGIANYQLNNLFSTLKGDPDLNSPRSLSQEA